MNLKKLAITIAVILGVATRESAATIRTDSPKAPPLQTHRRRDVRRPSKLSRSRQRT